MKYCSICVFDKRSVILGGYISCLVFLLFLMFRWCVLLFLFLGICRLCWMLLLHFFRILVGILRLCCIGIFFHFLLVGSLRSIGLFCLSIFLRRGLLCCSRGGWMCRVFWVFLGCIVLVLCIFFFLSVLVVIFLVSCFHILRRILFFVINYSYTFYDTFFF